MRSSGHCEGMKEFWGELEKTDSGETPGHTSVKKSS